MCFFIFFEIPNVHEIDMKYIFHKISQNNLPWKVSFNNFQWEAQEQQTKIVQKFEQKSSGGEFFSYEFLNVRASFSNVVSTDKNYILEKLNESEGNLAKRILLVQRATAMRDVILQWTRINLVNSKLIVDFSKMVMSLYRTLKTGTIRRRESR